MAKVMQFLDYAATHPNAIVTYHASKMVLPGHSNASYLSESNARSRAGGQFFMSNNTAKPPNNGTILTTVQIIKAVMSSAAAEAEVGALYISCREAVPACQTLEFMGHPQPPTPMQTDNTTALGVVDNNVIKKPKLMDMKYHWLRDRIFADNSNTTGPLAKKTMATTQPSIMLPSITKQHAQLFSHH
jgi:hypothetical protein